MRILSLIARFTGRSSKLEGKKKVKLTTVSLSALLSCRFSPNLDLLPYIPCQFCGRAISNLSECKKLELKFNFQSEFFVCILDAITSHSNTVNG